MKHFYILLVIPLFFSQAQAQDLMAFPQDNFVQASVYKGNYFDRDTSNRSIYYYGDTVLNGEQYNLFKWTLGIRYGQLTANAHYTQWRAGKIYHYMANGDGSLLLATKRLLYDFNLQIGDTFYTYFHNRVVDSIGVIILANGQGRRYIRMHDYKNIIYEWVDGIGDIKSGFIYDFDWEGGHHHLICQRDFSGLVFENPKTTFDCSSYIGEALTVEVADNLELYKLYPNPVTDILHFESPDILKITEIVFRDIKGQIVYQVDRPKINSFNLEFLLSGLYWVEIMDDKYTRHSKIIKQ